MPSRRNLQRQKAGDQLNSAPGNHQSGVYTARSMTPTSQLSRDFWMLWSRWMVLVDIGPKSLLNQRPQHQVAHHNRKSQIRAIRRSTFVPFSCQSNLGPDLSPCPRAPYTPRSRRRARTKLLTQKYPNSASHRHRADHLAPAPRSALMPTPAQAPHAPSAPRAKIPKNAPETSSHSTPESRTNGSTACPKLCRPGPVLPSHCVRRQSSGPWSWLPSPSQ